MLRFFRQIRQRLLTDNKFSKYLLYAVGEILLVVIGILIALQIDNWNEERVLRKKELLYLKEIRINLWDDLGNITHSLNFNKEKDSIIKACMNAMLEASSDQEAMQAISRNMPILAEFSVFTQNRVAFDNMLSAENIDLISRDSLRTMLSTYYSEKNLLSGTQERVKELTRNFVDNITPSLMNRENITQFFGRSNNLPSASDLNFRNNQVLFGNLFGMQRNIEAHIVFLEDYQKIVERLLGEIEDFLDQEK